ncbi:MAG TPA: hypothetical protein VFX70_09410, partial [Mycobacteriales bacterium]|nr:hypothetical protein [Mycobacteriales bacterium]
APGPVEFVPGDVGDPRVASLLAEADTVVHVGTGAGGTDPAGTRRLLAACQHSTRLRRVVVRSTAAVYPAARRDPALFVETDAGGARDRAEGWDGSWPGAGPGRDAAETEAQIRAFGRCRPDVRVTVLRLANLVGPRVPTRLARYFGPPAVPTACGHDPRLQFLHEHDAVEVFRLAALGEHRSTVPPRADGRTPPGNDGAPWPVNVAGAGVLMLSQAIRRAGRVPLPLPGPASTLLTGLLRRAGLAHRHAGQVADLGARLHPGGLLTVGAIVDTTRLRREFGYLPRYTSVQAFDEFVRGQLRAGRIGWPADV